MVNLGVDLAGIKLKNPLLTASGTYGFGRNFLDFYHPEILGGIINKTLRLHPHPGNPPPRIAETPAGLLNAVGIPSRGWDHYLAEEVPYLAKLGVPVIQSLVGETEEEYVELARRCSALGFLAGLELNLSCPNLQAGGLSFGLEPQAVRRLVSRVREATPLPLIVKLTPNTGDVVALAKAAAEAGADALSLINTVKAMAIDIRTKRPVLGNITGGLSGPAIKPIALYHVWEVYQAVSLPLIGMGGIWNYQDVLEFILAGARAVALGTVNFVDPLAPVRILADLEKYLKQNGIDDINTLVGAAHAHLNPSDGNGLH